jgi:hypothetical protein
MRNHYNPLIRTANSCNQYDEDDVDLYNEEHIDRIIAQQQFDKEDEKDFDDSF